MIYTFRALSEETEIYAADDDDAAPIVVVRFLEGETVETHVERVHTIINALNAAASVTEAGQAAPGVRTDKDADEGVIHGDPTAVKSALIVQRDDLGYITLHERNEEGHAGDLVASVWRDDWLPSLQAAQPPGEN
ncbi:hypothetical protein [Sphingomonas sp. 3-13AW]|uniref:hypothetical protein n=1 Tax=Sphingomonas sp. 3-13AW TaxID=3050450 RepID=UPI003BB4B88C